MRLSALALFSLVSVSPAFANYEIVSSTVRSPCSVKITRTFIDPYGALKIEMQSPIEQDILVLHAVTTPSSHKVGNVARHASKGTSTETILRPQADASVEAKVSIQIEKCLAS